MVLSCESTHALLILEPSCTFLRSPAVPLENVHFFYSTKHISAEKLIFLREAHSPAACSGVFKNHEW